MKPDPRVSRVFVVFKTHLDIGFTDLARNVVRLYCSHFIPGALRLAEQTRDRPARFVWTAGSWLIYHYLENASRPERRRMEAAIASGDIHWHALPFTTHTELLDASLFSLGLRFRDRLDARFGRITRAAKMTDVPGHTRAMVPLLADAGVRLLHIGVNPASSVPDVPPAFVWRVDGRELVVLYDKVYGSTKRLPGGLAMSVNLTGDNLGPPSAEKVAGIYAGLRCCFPAADLVPGTLSDLADLLWTQRASLPSITAEIGDSWIHGVGTDPGKIARFRALSRLRRQFLADGKLTEGSDADLKFGENLLLVAEHTWGLDIKTYLRDFRTYRRETFARALEKPNFRAVASSWAEQREYLARALAALPPTLRPRAEAELRALRPRRQATARWRKVVPGQEVQLGTWKFLLDPESGSVSYLSRGESVLLPAKSRFGLASFSYQSFSRADYQRFYRQYNTDDKDWARKDFTKVGLPASAESGWHVPRVSQLHVAPSGEAAVAELVFAPAAQRVGAPRMATMHYRVSEEALNVKVQWFQKPASRLPEALWLGFQPALPRTAGWTLEKLGRAIDPRDVVRRGGRGLHACTGPVTAEDFSITSLDAVLVAPGNTKLLDFDDRLPRRGAGIHFNLWNNVWNTNFPQWYADDASFRFELRWANRGSTSQD